MFQELKETVTLYPDIASLLSSTKAEQLPDKTNASLFILQSLSQYFDFGLYIINDRFGIKTFYFKIIQFQESKCKFLICKLHKCYDF